MTSRAALLALSLSVFSACGDDTTGRARVRFAVSARGVDTSFTTSRGWSLTVREARLSLGALRWYEGAPLFALRWWERALGVSIAHAHPGHYVPGAALADTLAPRVIDLTGPSVALDAADGVTGAALSAHVEVLPSAELSGDTLFVRGEATMGAQTVRFRTSLPLTLALEGVPASGDIDANAWELQVSVGRWLDRVDFAALAPATPGDEVTFGADSQAMNALTRGASSVGSYRVVKLTPGDAGP